MTSKNDPNRIEKQAHKYAEYEARDQKGEPVGQVDDLFVDTVNGQSYVELNMGVLGLRSTVVPLEICTVDEENMTIVIPHSKAKLKRAPRKRAPLLGDEVMAITPEYENRIRDYFGLKALEASTEERPFRAFSTAHASQDKMTRSEVRPVEVRRVDRKPVEPRTDQSRAAGESEVEKSAPEKPLTGQLDAVDAQSAGPVEPGAAGPQNAEAARSSEVEERREAAAPEAIDLAAAEDETVEVHAVKPVAETDATPRVRKTRRPEGKTRTSAPLEKPAAESSDDVETPGASDYSVEAESQEPAEDVASVDERELVTSNEKAPQAIAAQTEEIEAAGREMTEAARESWQALANRAVTVQEGNLALSRGLAQTFVEQLQDQTQGNRQATQALQQHGQRQQQALQTIVQDSMNVYANLLSSTISAYQQTLQSATRAALNNLQAATRLTQGDMQAPASVVQQGSQDVTGQAGGQAAPQGSGEAPREPSP